MWFSIRDKRADEQPSGPEKPDVAADEEDRAVEVYLVWQLPWAPDYMSEAAKEQLGW